MSIHTVGASAISACDGWGARSISTLIVVAEGIRLVAIRPEVA